MYICAHFHTKEKQKKTCENSPTTMPTKCFHDELDSLVFQIPNYACSPFATNVHKEDPKNNLSCH
jgi:hypothetical protein